MAFYLAYKEVLRNRGRFFLFSLVIALITTLVLFVAALAQGLAVANKQYLEKLDAQLLVFQKNVDLSTAVSQIGRSRLNDIRRVAGVSEAAGIGFSSVSIVSPSLATPLDVSLIGVEAGRPGEPPVNAGRGLRSSRASEAVIDQQIAQKLGLRVGDTFTIKSIQATEEKYYNLAVVGITDRQQYLYRPSLFVPYLTWDEVRPQSGIGPKNGELVTNVVAVKLRDPATAQDVAHRIQSEVANVEVADLRTSYESIPGYKVQQSTLNTQQAFVLLIGVLIVGGFFQIQMLQKIPQIGVLKAIGASNLTVAAAAVLQIVLVSTFGVFAGGLATLLLSIAMPATTPIVFNGPSILFAILALLSIGPLGGLVTVRLAVRVEPLAALGLSS